MEVEGKKEETGETMDRREEGRQKKKGNNR